jgi:hypothetical protein
VKTPTPVISGDADLRDHTVDGDAELQALVDTWRRADPDGVRMGGVLRRVLDDILDGTRTGRYQWAQLSKVEKTMFGQLVQRELGREFGLADAALLDFEFGGVEFDVTYATGRRWLIPPESVGRLVFLVSLDPIRGRWDAGLVRALPELLSDGMNRDRKRALRDVPEAVQYLSRDALLPQNVIQVLGEDDRRVILTRSSGRQRVEELLRRAQGRLIDRTTIATVARQTDAMKRVRDVQLSLAGEGIAVLIGRIPGHEVLVRELGMPDLDGKVMSVRLVRRSPNAPDQVAGIEIGGEKWVPARPCDPVEPLPHPVRARR